MKKAICIFGPEHVGNKVMKKIMKKCFGCEEISNEIDKELVVHNNSVPTSGKWITPDIISKPLIEKGYDIIIVVPVRDWWCTYRSHYHDHMKEIGKPKRTKNEHDEFVSKGYKEIFKNIIDMDLKFITITYESMVYNKERFLKGLAKSLELKLLSTDIDIYDGNEKYTMEILSE